MLSNCAVAMRNWKRCLSLPSIHHQLFTKKCNGAQTHIHMKVSTEHINNNLSLRSNACQKLEMFNTCLTSLSE